MKNSFLRLIHQVTPAMNPANLLTRDHREAVANSLNEIQNPTHSGERMKRFALLFPRDLYSNCTRRLPSSDTKDTRPYRYPHHLLQMLRLPHRRWPPSKPNPGSKSPRPSCTTSSPTSPSASNSRTASCSSSRRITSCPSSQVRSPSPAARAMKTPPKPASSASTARPGAPAAPPSSAATPSTICSKPRPRTSRPAATSIPPRSPGTRSKPTPTRSFPWPSTCSCIPTSPPRSSSSPAAGGHRHRPPQRRRRRDRRPRSRQARLRRQLALHPPAGAGHHRRGHAGRPEGMARPNHWRQAHRLHQRRLRPRGDGSQTARGLRASARGQSLYQHATTASPIPSPESSSSTRKM
jgi:hypothetical protein